MNNTSGCLLVMLLTSGWLSSVCTASGLWNWTKYDNTIPADSDGVSTNGRIPLGSAGKGDAGQAAYPSVIKDGSTYKMWYSGYAGTTWRIYYATSPDGLTWTKYDNTIPADSDGVSTNGRIPLGSAGKGDDMTVVYPTVIKDGPNDYKMWYAGYSSGAPVGYRIYLATSPDGLTWTKYNNTKPPDSNSTSTDGRVAAGGFSYGDDAGAMYPTVINDNGTYKIWYVGFESGKFRIYHATSPDGLTWTKYDNSIPANSDTNSTNGRIPLGTAGQGDELRASLPVVIKDRYMYRMWYGGYENGAKYRVYYATSPDGLTWTKYDNSIPDASNTTSSNGRIPVGTTGRGDDIKADSSSSLIKETVPGGSVYKMWYSGGDGDNWRIYYATMFVPYAGTIFTIR